MASNKDIYKFLRSSEELLRSMRQRASDSWQSEASLIAGSRVAIVDSRALLTQMSHLFGPDSERPIDEARGEMAIEGLPRVMTDDGVLFEELTPRPSGPAST